MKDSVSRVPAARFVNLGVPSALALATAAYLAAIARMPAGAPMLFLVIAALLLGGVLVALGRSLASLARPGAEEPARISARLRGEIEREKARTLRSLKELQFDHAMGKVSDQDFRTMGDALRERAIRYMKDLDSAAGPYEQAIAAEVEARLGAGGASATQTQTQPQPQAKAPDATSTKRACAGCGAGNDEDAAFCKKCGAAMARTCAGCSTRNDADAAFCKRCGKSL